MHTAQHQCMSQKHAFTLHTIQTSLKGISKMQHFHFTADRPGYVFVKNSSDIREFCPDEVKDLVSPYPYSSSSWYFHPHHPHQQYNYPGPEPTVRPNHFSTFILKKFNCI